VVYFSVYVVCFDISFNLFSSDFYNINVFSGIPGSAKSALCKELLNAPGGFGDDRPVHTLMGDLVKGKYWPKVADERRKKPQSIMLADKNAPNEDVWRQVINPTLRICYNLTLSRNEY
jgi:hypothetical protein